MALRGRISAQSASSQLFLSPRACGRQECRADLMTTRGILERFAGLVHCLSFLFARLGRGDDAAQCSQRLRHTLCCPRPEMRRAALPQALPSACLRLHSSSSSTSISTGPRSGASPRAHRHSLRARASRSVGPWRHPLPARRRDAAAPGCALTWPRKRSPIADALMRPLRSAPNGRRL